VGTKYTADNWCINWVIQAPSPHQDHSTNAISAGGGGKCKVGDGIFQHKMETETQKLLCLISDLRIATGQLRSCVNWSAKISLQF